MTLCIGRREFITAAVAGPVMGAAHPAVLTDPILGWGQPEGDR